MARIHPTAVVDPGARLDDDVTIGPFAVIGGGVEIGAGTTVGPHAVIEGETRIGRDNHIFQFVSLGAAPQDKKYAGEPTRVEIGDRNVLREFVTAHRGTAQGRGVTRIGDDNLLMAYVHVAHDCIVGNKTIFANCSNLGGHVSIDDWVVLGGFTGVHQFCKVGAHVMAGVGSVILHDVPPFVRVAGNTASAHGINSMGLRRRGFDDDTVNVVKRAYRTLYRMGLTLDEARAALAVQVESLRQDGSPPLAEASIRLLIDFLGKVTRGIVR
jgi:UDP-N-acetylglucosamine acyltransferase